MKNKICRLESGLNILVKFGFPIEIDIELNFSDKKSFMWQIQIHQFYVASGVTAYFKELQSHSRLNLFLAFIVNPMKASLS